MPAKKSKNVGRPVGAPAARNVVGLHPKTPVGLGASGKTKNTMAAISTMTTAHTTTEPTPTVLPPAPVAAPVAVSQPPPVPSPVVPPSQPTKVHLAHLSVGSCSLGACFVRECLYGRYGIDCFL